MSITATGGVTAASHLGDLLLESKVAVPPRRHTSVSRRDVIERLAGDDSTIVSVCAPAGYGKTTLLSEWASTETRAVGWASLDATDNDASNLLSLIARACAAFSPQAAAVVDQMRGIGSSSLSRSAPLLAAALSAARTGFVLFIDDAHLADSTECQDVLEVALGRIPTGSQVVLASRQEPAVLARMRAAGLATGASVTDLCLDRDGAQAVFDRAHVPIGDADLRMILAKTEGWPAGVFLSAQIVRADGDTAAIGGDHRYLSDYLYRECLARLPEALQRFLRRAAVLERFSTEVCVAVTGMDDARGMIRQLDDAHLFVVSLQRGWYRFHALFREFLIAECERVEGAATVVALHRRAAAWLSANGLPDAAVEHLLSAGDRREAAEITSDLALSLYDQGRLPTLRRWLDAVGEQAIQEYSPLAVIAAWVGALTGNLAEGERWSHIVAGIDADRLADDEAASFVAARATLQTALCAHGARQAVADASSAVSRHPAWSPWRAVALHLQGSAFLLVGDEKAAQAAFADAVALAESTEIADPAILSEPELALLALREGRTSQASVHAERGVELVATSRMVGYPVTGLALAVGARLALREDHVDRAKQLLVRGMRARADATYQLPFLAVRTRLNLAKAHSSLGDRAAARHLLREIDEILVKRPDLGMLVDEVNRFRRALDDDPLESGTTPLTPAELRLLPYLQTHLTIGEIGERLFVSRNTVSSEVSSIYRKLGVTTRSAAVDRATSLGMLGD